MNNISKTFQQRKRGKYQVEIVEGVYGFMTPIAKMAKNVPARKAKKSYK
jgi:dethiobiotin synthetase